MKLTLNAWNLNIIAMKTTYIHNMLFVIHNRLENLTIIILASWSQITHTLVNFFHFICCEVVAFVVKSVYVVKSAFGITRSSYQRVILLKSALK